MGDTTTENVSAGGGAALTTLMERTAQDSSSENFELLFLIVKVILRLTGLFMLNSPMFSSSVTESVPEPRLCWSRSWRTPAEACCPLAWTGRVGDTVRPSLISSLSSRK